MIGSEQAAAKPALWLTVGRKYAALWVLLPIFYILLAYVLYPNLHILIQSFFDGQHFTFVHLQRFFETRASLQALWGVFIFLC